MQSEKYIMWENIQDQLLFSTHKWKEKLNLESDEICELTEI